MSSKGQSSSAPLRPPSKPTTRRPRFARIRGWLRSRTGRVVVPAVTLILGIGLGVVGLLLYALSFAAEGRPLVTPLPPPGSDIVVQIGPAYIARLLEKDLSTLSLPGGGNIVNVRVKLADSDRTHLAELTVTGDNQVSLFGIETTRQLTVIVQPLVNACQIQVHVLHADLGGIALTGLFTVAFESQINQQLQIKLSSLPAGFIYCTTGVRTKPQGLFVTYSATPESQ